MTNTRAAREEVFDLLKKLLGGSGDPPFDNCFVGRPMQIAERRTIHFWFDGEEPANPGRKTLGNVMMLHRFTVRSYYQMAAAVAEAEAMELQMWHDCRDVQEAVRAYSSLEDNVVDLDIEMQDTTSEEVFDDGRRFRALTWMLRLEELEGEAIAA